MLDVPGDPVSRYHVPIQKHMNSESSHTSSLNSITQKIRKGQRRRHEQIQSLPKNMGSSSSGAGGGGSVARSTSLSPLEKGEKCFNTTTKALMLSQPLPHPCKHAQQPCSARFTVGIAE